MSDELNDNFDRPVQKYVLCPGYVHSKNDGDRHYITATRLVELYRVPLNDCVVKPNMDDPRNKHWSAPQGAIELHPKFDGNYTLQPNV